jgi:hypothetical protein
MSPDRRHKMTDSPGEDFGGKIQRETAKTLGPAIVAVTVILVLAIVQNVRFGFRAADYIVLIIGSVVSMVVMLSYGLTSIMRAYGSPMKPWMGLATIGGMLPNFFFMYVLIYRGIWFIAVPIINGYSYIISGSYYTPIFQELMFCTLSLYSLRQFLKITEMGREVNTLIKTARESPKSPN